jgi:hypothetical protein
MRTLLTKRIKKQLVRLCEFARVKKANTVITGSDGSYFLSLWERIEVRAYFVGKLSRSKISRGSIFGIDVVLGCE